MFTSNLIFQSYLLHVVFCWTLQFHIWCTLHLLLCVALPSILPSTRKPYCYVIWNLIFFVAFRVFFGVWVFFYRLWTKRFFDITWKKKVTLLTSRWKKPHKCVLKNRIPSWYMFLYKVFYIEKLRHVILISWFGRWFVCFKGSERYVRMISLKTI